ncbi:cytochrome bd-I oxidase subunit CydX [Paraburkholderia susongensis]|uniref:Cyd operon protein YbgT n=1 Tax=Paraburkholderia susongensis TaxID=1515439 RepID=A0A1X7JUM7_9BURK|nr:cytochrome bd-I oxidase subunit CydX [Paraburkholderia susongensis]SMG32083.1 cyd operon protein YbgT [Paraburkholderia susongensis]
MWYFSWMLGIGVALAFGIVNVMWLESHHNSRDKSREALQPVKRTAR